MRNLNAFFYSYYFIIKFFTFTRYTCYAIIDDILEFILCTELHRCNFIIIVIILGMAIFDQKRTLPFSIDSLFEKI
jgi:hypothetical protein